MTMEMTSIQNALYPRNTVPESIGWNRAEIMDLWETFGDGVKAAVLVPLIETESGWNILFTRRSDQLSKHAGQISFPGGRMDTTDPDVVFTALREAQEEIGLQGENVDVLGYLDVIDSITGYRVYPVVGRIRQSFKPLLNIEEVSDVFELPLQWLMNPLHLHQTQMQYKSRTRTIFEYTASPHYPQHRIWGLTAAILWNLRQRLEKFHGNN